MSKHLRYGIIGCGMMGQEHIRNVHLLPDTTVAAIFEPDAGMRGLSAALAPNAKFTNSIDDLLSAPDIDCIVIASPNHVHVSQLSAISHQRHLPILVEKPLFTAPDDDKSLADVMAGYDAPVWVAMEYRYMPPIAAFLAEADAITGGIKMLTIREHRFPFLTKVGDWNRFNRNTGGTFVEKCCHFFDLMRLALRAEPVRVTASAGQDVNHLDERYGGERPDILDNGYVIVDFDSGARAMLELCMFAEGAAYQEELSAVGPRGKLEAFVPGPQRFWPEDLGPPPEAKLVSSPRVPKRPTSRHIGVEETILAAGDHNGSTFYQHQRFAALVRGELALPDVSLSDGIKAVQMGHAAQEAARTHTVVTL